jgi:hypothetical protein
VDVASVKNKHTVYVKDEKLLKIKSLINTVFGPENNNKVTTCHVQV